MATVTAQKTPYLRNVEGTSQLIVDGQPFLMLAGELQNSSFSSSQHMSSIWPKFTGANLNTILGSVSWEEIEPIEGHFNFTNLDENMIAARHHGLKLVLLWFGGFKNGKSTYVPSWVKMNPHRFPRAELRGPNGQLTTPEVLSIFGTEAQKADAKAFAALMQHLHHVDQSHSTVIMVQVENEVGLLGDSRDRSVLAEKRFNEATPDDLWEMFANKSGCNEKFRENFSEAAREKCPADATWGNLPAPPVRIDELFMAYHFCKYVEQVASAGKAQYNLPMYTNVWQNYGDEDSDPSVPTIVGGGSDPGDYPSGGAVNDVLDLWQNFAPSLDFIAPDIYLNDYVKTCYKYTHRGQPLFIPEQRRDEYGVRRIWHAFGCHNCLGTAPFGIDTLEPISNPVRQQYALLRDISHYIIDAQAGKLTSFGLFFDELLPDGKDPDSPFVREFGTWKLKIERSFVFGQPSAGCGMVIFLGGARFLLVGWGFQVTFTSSDPKAYFSGILKFEEQEIVNWRTGEMIGLRRLNGDETRSGAFAIMPSGDPDYGGFPISVTIPAKTGIAICEPYALLRE